MAAQDTGNTSAPNGAEKPQEPNKPQDPQVPQENLIETITNKVLENISNYDFGKKPKVENVDEFKAIVTDSIKTLTDTFQMENLKTELRTLNPQLHELSKNETNIDVIRGLILAQKTLAQQEDPKKKTIKPATQGGTPNPNTFGTHGEEQNDGTAPRKAKPNRQYNRLKGKNTA